MAASEPSPIPQDPTLSDTTPYPVVALQSRRAQVEFGAVTHIGKVRPTNQDQYLIARLSKSFRVLSSSLPDDREGHETVEDGYLILVADGMGGPSGGGVASALAIEGVKQFVLHTAKWFFPIGDPDEELAKRILQEGLMRIDHDLIKQARADPSLHGMGTTLTAARTLGNEVLLVQIGDSRAYLFRGGELDQLTRDQTMTQQLVDAGLLAPEEARRHRLRHVLTNVLGGQPGVRGEIVQFRTENGDRLLLCSDGLTGAVEDAAIAASLMKYPKPQEACEALIHAALAGGGRDNITVVVAAFAVEGG
jgi:serine/threonine protein phosphatase PrpC